MRRNSGLSVTTRSSPGAGTSLAGAEPNDHDSQVSAMQSSTAQFLMHNVLGEPGTMTRAVQYWSTAALLFLPLVYVLSSLRHRAIAFWTVVVGGGILIYFGVAWITDRLYLWLRRRYGEP